MTEPALAQNGLAIAESLRTQMPTLRVQVNMGGGSMKSQLRRADRSGAAFALILGPSEAAAGEINIKDLRGETEQYTVAIDRLPAVLSSFDSR